MYTLRNIAAYLLLFSMLSGVLQAESQTEMDDVNRGKADAQRDADRDTFELGWLAAGCFTGYSMTFGFLCLSSAAEGDDLFYTSEEKLSGGCGMIAIGTIPISILSVKNRHITPYPDRYMGKSPEYVDAYIDNYSKEVKRLRSRSFLGGNLISVLSVPILIFSLSKL